MSHHRTPGMHVESFGAGPELVMLHGWAMHGGLLRDFAERLSSRCRVSLVDLPGHGQSGTLADYSLTAVTDALLAVTPPTAHWLGWSLGALLAIGVAHARPGRVRSLALIAGTPRFTAQGEWPGVSPALLAQMGIDLEQDYALTLKRFIALQTHGQPEARALARLIQARLDECPPPDDAALRGGLDLLQATDLRNALDAGEQPMLAVLGAHDRLVPRAVATSLSALKPHAEIHALATAAHLPFLTHPGDTAELLQAFHDRHAGQRPG